MIASTVVNTDLVTPLGAYLHLRELRRGSFLLESVEKGRLGRYSLVGCGDRLVTFEEAASAVAPVVGYVGYDHIAKLEPTVALPDDGPACRRACSSSPTCSSASTTRAGSPRCSPATRTSSRGCCRRRSRRSPSRRAARAERPAAGPRASTTSAASSRAGSTSAAATPSRSCSRSAPSGPPACRHSQIYRSLRRVNPSPYLFLLELESLALVGSSPETLVRCENGREPR